MKINIIVAIVAAILSNLSAAPVSAVKSGVEFDKINELKSPKISINVQDKKEKDNVDINFSGHLKYENIISKYITAFNEDWDEEEYNENAICYLVSENSSLEDIGYCFMDLDTDGISELFIGKTKGDSLLYEVYTLKDGVPVSLLCSQERNRYFYCIDGLFENESSGGADYTTYMYYTLEQGKLTERASLFYDGSDAENGPWFYNSKAPWDSHSNPLREESVQIIFDNHVHMILPFTPLSQYQGIGNESPISPAIVGEENGQGEPGTEKAVA